MSMRFSSRLLAVALCLFVACACFAQGGRQGRGGRNNTSLLGLVNRADVQADLVITDDEKTKLEAMRAGFAPPAQGATPMTPEERAAQNMEREKQLAAILTPAQMTRLHEIQIQLEGITAITHKEVQTGLGLSAAQIGQITDQEKTYREANQAIQAKIRDGSLDRQSARPETTKNTATYRENLTKVLTSDQADKLKAMGGKMFTPAAPPAPAGGL